MASRYRRTVAEPVTGARADAGDPYAQYLNWVAEGRPSLSIRGEALIDGPIALAARPEEDTVLLADHVQVQQRASGGTESLIPRSRWRRVLDAIRGPNATNPPAR
jgi:hypothetical protein